MLLFSLIAFSASVASALQAPRNPALTHASTKLGLKVDASVPGQLPPTGFFDPLGFTTEMSEIEFKKYQEAELKHGRVCMLAAAGMLFAERIHPLFGGKIMGPSINHFQQVESVFPPFWYIILSLIAFVEGNTILKGWGDIPPTTGVANMKPDYIPGDLGFDPLSILKEGDSFNPDSYKFKEYRTKEIQNGRLAMIAVAGMVAQELVDGRPILEHLAKFGLSYAGPGTNL